MRAYSVVVTFEPPDEVERQFRERLNVKVLPSGLPCNSDELASAVSGYDAIIVTPPTQVSAETFTRLPSSIKAIATYTKGREV